MKDRTFLFQLQTRFKGITLQINSRVWGFFWQPICSGYYDAEGIWHKSKKFQYLTYKI